MVRSHSPSAENVAARTVPLCSVNMDFRRPVRASQRRAVESPLAVAIAWPLGEKAAARTLSVCPSSVAIVLPFAAFQIRAVLSKLAVTIRDASGENEAP